MLMDGYICKTYPNNEPVYSTNKPVISKCKHYQFLVIETKCKDQFKPDVIKEALDLPFSLALKPDGRCSPMSLPNLLSTPIAAAQSELVQQEAQVCLRVPQSGLDIHGAAGQDMGTCHFGPLFSHSVYQLGGRLDWGKGWILQHASKEIKKFAIIIHFCFPYHHDSNPPHISFCWKALDLS